jgi:hypothetical protein
MTAVHDQENSKQPRQDKPSRREEVREVIRQHVDDQQQEILKELRRLFS